MFSVYVLENQTDSSWYIGYTSDLKRRVEDHNNGKGCRTTSLMKDWKLMYYEAYINKADVVGREKFLKSGRDSGQMCLNKIKKYKI